MLQDFCFVLREIWKFRYENLYLAGLIIFIFTISPVYADFNQSNGIEVNLNVNGCNTNGVCESGETLLSCPIDCFVTIPSYGRGGATSPKPVEEIFVYNISVQPNFTSVVIYWNSSVGVMSAIKWGETTEVKDGALRSVVFALNHKMEIINLKPGTMYYFTIESEDANGKTNINPPIYFFTKFLKDTTFPLNPRNVKALADISGITVSWQNPPDDNFSYIRIMRHEDSFRGDPFSGKLIYEDSAEKFLDKNVVAGKKYFYSLFSRDKNGDFSSGVGVSIVAYFSEKTSIPEKIPELKRVEEKPPGDLIIETENFFVYQYNQPAEPLAKTKSVALKRDKDTVVETNKKTLPDDWVEVKNQEGETVGQYLFSFNKDSGRYQSVIPPLEREGVYDVKIYRYKDNVPIVISEGSLNVKGIMAPKAEKYYGNVFITYYPYIIILILLFILLLLAF